MFRGQGVRSLVIVCGALVATACGSNHSEIQALLWDTTGGGDLHFSAVKASSDYQIVVTQKQFSAVNLTIRLTATDTTAYQLVTDIFAGHRDIRNDTFVPNGPTGTWTSITLMYADGRTDVVHSIEASGELGQLYSFVSSRLASSEPSPLSSTARTDTEGS
jgi:hypothetical protein